MAIVEWKDEYSVGVAMIDEDHKELLRLIGELTQAISSDPADAPRLCDALIEHTLAHFNHEEQWFETLNYPQADQHRRMHQKLKQRLVEYRSQLDLAPATGPLALFTDYLAHHITGADRSYGAWLNAQGIH